LKLLSFQGFFHFKIIFSPHFMQRKTTKIVVLWCGILCVMWQKVWYKNYACTPAADSA